MWALEFISPIGLFEAGRIWMDIEGEWQPHMIGRGELCISIGVSVFFD
jgi:hypothetical protein